MTSGFRSKLSKLTLSQWLYLVAIIIMLANFEKDIEYGAELYWIGTIAGIGLARELWHIFNRLWQQLIGKGLILVLYAATANIALAVSALKINIITGVEPSPFVFTLGFTTLIMLPFWLLVSSILFFTFALVASNVWLVIGALLRLVRIKVRVHWEDRTFIFSTMILRVVLIPYVIMSLVYILVPYAQQIEIFDNAIAEIKSKNNDDSSSVNVESANSEGLIDEDLAETQEPAFTINGSFNGRLFQVPVDSDGQVKWLDKLIASFVYHFETYPKSACKKSLTQRSLILDENTVLLVNEGDSPLGYDFAVAPCVGDYKTTQVE